MRIVLYPHQMASKGARNLRDCFRRDGWKSILVRANGKYRPRPTDLILGWGNSNLPNWPAGIVTKWVNHYGNIPNATNKRLAFIKFQEAEVKTPDATVDEVVAKDWLKKGKTVIGRLKLQASRGEGIVVMQHPDQFVPCPLYTKWKSADREYRVYVLNDKVIDYLQKKRPNGAEDLGIIRSAAQGWVYCRTDIKPLPEKAEQEAIKAVKALGLQFGGVDLLWGNKTGAHILEVNTSPGIEGIGVQKIASAMLEQYTKGVA